MEEGPIPQTVEIDGDRFISIEYERRWPKWVAVWSVRQRAGDGDFPVARGEVESRAVPGDQAAEDIIETLRQESLDRAMAASNTAPQVTDEKQPSLLGRLFRRG